MTGGAATSERQVTCPARPYTSHERLHVGQATQKNNYNIETVSFRTAAHKAPLDVSFASTCGDASFSACAASIIRDCFNAARNPVAKKLDPATCPFRSYQQAGLCKDGVRHDFHTRAAHVLTAADSHKRQEPTSATLWTCGAEEDTTRGMSHNRADGVRQSRRWRPGDANRNCARPIDLSAQSFILGAGHRFAAVRSLPALSFSDSKHSLRDCA